MSYKLTLKWRSCLLALTLHLLDHCSSEESTILEGATTSEFEFDSSWSWSDRALIDGAFKTAFHSDGENNYNGDKEFSIILQESVSLVTAYFQNRADSKFNSRRLGSAKIFAGEDTIPYSSNLIACSGVFFDSGFIQLSNDCKGKRVSIRRLGLPEIFYTTILAPNQTIFLNVNELRLYQVPNLLQTQLGVVTISAPQEYDLQFTAQNLITNLDIRNFQAHFANDQKAPDRQRWR